MSLALPTAVAALTLLAPAPTPEARAEALNKAFAAAMVAGDAAAVAACYTEDGQLFFFQGQTLKGRAAIRATLTEMFKDMRVKAMTITSQEVHALGSHFLVDQGTYAMTTVGADGKETTQKARYLQLLRKDADGQWRLFRDCPLAD